MVGEGREGWGSRVDYSAQRKEKACSPGWSQRGELPQEPDKHALDFHIQE